MPHRIPRSAFAFDSVPSAEDGERSHGRSRRRERNIAREARRSEARRDETGREEEAKVKESGELLMMHGHGHRRILDTNVTPVSSIKLRDSA